METFKGEDLDTPQEDQGICERRIEGHQIDGYDIAVYKGDKIIGLRGKMMPHIDIGMPATLITHGERKCFMGDIQLGDKVTVIGFCRPDESFGYGGRSIVQISKDEHTDWIRPHYLQEAKQISIDMRQRQTQDWSK
ncbi:hypothetical protein ACFL3C_01380 [Patescibacteria group bacterium]